MRSFSRRINQCLTYLNSWCYVLPTHGNCSWYIRFIYYLILRYHFPKSQHEQRWKHCKVVIDHIYYLNDRCYFPLDRILTRHFHYWWNWINSNQSILLHYLWIMEWINHWLRYWSIYQQLIRSSSRLSWSLQNGSSS